jgi:hypothetical protein
VVTGIAGGFSVPGFLGGVEEDLFHVVDGFPWIICLLSPEMAVDLMLAAWEASWFHHLLHV